MPSTKKQLNRKKKTVAKASDTVFLFKLVIYLILGSLWIKVYRSGDLSFAFPVGLIIGLILSANEHFRVDRKIEYAVLMIATLIGFWAPVGLFIKF
jgi:hypothetical protein